jgi:hypothetical protein
MLLFAVVAWLVFMLVGRWRYLREFKKEVANEKSGTSG